MDELAGLVLEDLGDAVVCVAEGVDGDAAGKVEELAVVRVVELAALAPGEDKVGAGVGVEGDGAVALEFVLHVEGDVVVEVGRGEVVCAGLVGVEAGRRGGEGDLGEAEARGSGATRQAGGDGYWAGPHGL